MPPTDRFVICFAAEPPQDSLPSGRWADTLRQHFLTACGQIETEGEELGQIGDVNWFPDRTYGGRTYVPAVARSDEGYEVYGYVSFAEGGEDGAAPSDFEAYADFTSELAESNPDWRLDLSDEVIGRWRGELGKTADITLVWGVPMIAGGAMVTAEHANHAVDQCELIEQRFTMIAPDNYRGDYIDVKLWDGRGRELAAESIYADDEEEDEDAEPEV